MRLAYLVNIYPRVSHTFIKREILALEAGGATVERYTIRACDTPLVDETDLRELELTRVIQGQGAIGFLFALLSTLFTRPRLFFKAYRAAMKMRALPTRASSHTSPISPRPASSANGWAIQPPFTCTPITAPVPRRSHRFAGNWAGRRFRSPCTVRRNLNAAGQLALSSKVSQADFVVAISEFGRGQLCRWSDPIDWKKLNVVHCGVDERFLRNRDLPPITEGARLVCVGRLCVEKGQLVLLEAARLMVERGMQFELILAGDGPLRERLEQRIATAGLAAHVKITGWLSSEQVKQQILDSRAMVLPSFAEGLPVVIMEALALGRPVISTPVAGIPELLEQGKNGWLVQPGSPEQLAAAMTEAIQMPRRTTRPHGLRRGTGRRATPRRYS